MRQGTCLSKSMIKNGLGLGNRGNELENPVSQKTFQDYFDKTSQNIVAGNDGNFNGFG